MTTKAQGIERLRTLYAVMAGIPTKAINLSNWRDSKVTHRVSNEKLIAEHKCGTVACAVGWACAYPEFQAQGLRFEGSWPVYKGQENWAAVNAFFNLGDYDSKRLFMSGIGSLDRQADRGQLNDKRLILGRIRTYLLDAKVITRERNDELARAEPALCRGARKTGSNN